MHHSTVPMVPSMLAATGILSWGAMLLGRREDSQQKSSAIEVLHLRTTTEK